jgi:predicted AAA+ superfamily ATPase
LTGKKVRYLFLDEIQAITGWEKYVKTVYDNGVFEKIFITGSNSSFLNGELATLLTGRYLSSMVYPLSFSELLAIKGITSYMQLVLKKAEVLAIVDAMLKFGSFVEVVDSDEKIRRDIVSSYYDAILFKDCVSNNQIRDINSFRELSYYLISNIAAPFSYSFSGAWLNGIKNGSSRFRYRISPASQASAR